MAGRWLEEEFTRGWGPWEVTLSQTLWRGLADDAATSRRISMTVYSQDEEGTNGADWLWVFRTRGSTDLLPLLVQAKRLREGKYAINQKAGTITQVERLTKHAAAIGIPAAYVFFNPQSRARDVARRCSALPRHLLGGITLADATRVAAVAKAAGGVVRPDKVYGSLPIAQDAWPLSCALCCSRTHEWPPGDFTESIRASLQASGVENTTKIEQGSGFVQRLRALLDVAPQRAALSRLHESNRAPLRDMEQRFLAEHAISGVVMVEGDDDQLG